jgi:hypothetical protein
MTINLTQIRSDFDNGIIVSKQTLLALVDYAKSLEKDAERYRWLRDPQTDVALVIDKLSHEKDAYGGDIYEYRASDELDSEIDKARASHAL